MMKNIIFIMILFVLLNISIAFSHSDNRLKSSYDVTGTRQWKENTSLLQNIYCNKREHRGVEKEFNEKLNIVKNVNRLKSVSHMVADDVIQPAQTPVPEETVQPPLTPAAKTTQDLLEDAMELRKRGYTDGAIAIYDSIMKGEPNNTDNLLQFADMMVDMGNYSYAVMLYNKYLDIKPEDINTRKLVIDLYYSMGVYDFSIDECVSFLKDHPDNIDIITKLIEVYRKDNKFNDEMVTIEKLTDLQPDNKEALERLLDLYVIMGDYEKASAVIDKNPEFTSKFSQDKLAYIYLNGDKYEKSIEIYEKLYKNNPTSSTEYSLNQAKLAEINYKLENSPRFYSSYYNEMLGITPKDNYVNELLNYTNHEVSGFYGGVEYTKGNIRGNDYNNYYVSLFHPFISTGTELLITGNRYDISDDRLSMTHNSAGIELRQGLNKNFALGGGYTSGTLGNTYYGQLSFKSQYVEFAVRRKKDFQLETPEALFYGIYYEGTDFYMNIIPTDRLNFTASIGAYNFSDDNEGNYEEVAAFYKIWENQRNSWVTVGISHDWATHNFSSPFYFSPVKLEQWNYMVEWNYYFTPDSLLRLGYMYSEDNLNNSLNTYSCYIDHKFQNNTFIYLEYLNGLSHARAIGIQELDQRDYQLTLGLKHKF